MKRRAFFHAGATLAAAAVALPAGADKKETAPAMEPGAWVDTHVYLGAHPYRTSPWADPLTLAAQLRKRGVGQAWAGSFEALLHRDVAAVNARLVQMCGAAADLLMPVGCVNPVLPAWQDDLKRCAEKHGMKALRLHPNYHGYGLDDPRFGELLALAADHRLLVQVVAQMEDQRTQPPQLQARPVDMKPLPELLARHAEARVMVLNASALMVTTALRGCTRLWMDFAMLEGAGGVERLLQSWPPNKLCFGSHSPVFYWESAQLKMQESAIEGEALTAITRKNAAQALAVEG